MQFKVLTLAALCASTSAINFLFKNSPDYDRLVIFTPQQKSEPNGDYSGPIASVIVRAGKTKSVPIPDIWHGNVYSQRIVKGTKNTIVAADDWSKPNDPRASIVLPGYGPSAAGNVPPSMNSGMLAELSHKAGRIYYDVSAIVNPYDTNNVMRMYPTSYVPVAHNVAENGMGGCIIPTGSKITTCGHGDEIYGDDGDNDCVKNYIDAATGYADLVIELGNNAHGGSTKNAVAVQENDDNDAESTAAAPTTAAPTTAALTTAAPTTFSSIVTSQAAKPTQAPVTNVVLAPAPVMYQEVEAPHVVTVRVTSTVLWTPPTSTSSKHKRAHKHARAHARDSTV